jgi:hypothetical protein
VNVSNVQRAQRHQLGVLAMIRNVFCIVATFFMANVAFAQSQVFVGSLTGNNEAPPNASLGVGASAVTINATANTMRVNANFAGLTGNTAAAHIHCCTAVPGVGTAGVATTTPNFVGFPLGVTAGSYDTTFDMTLAGSYNAAFITANGGTPASAQAALFAGIAAGRAYLNIHSTTFGGGEIRSFLVLQTNSVAAPTLESNGRWLLILGAVGLGLLWLAVRRRA